MGGVGGVGWGGDAEKENSSRGARRRSREVCRWLSGLGS